MPKLAATEEYGFSPKLLAAKSSTFPSPLLPHQRVLGCFLAFICSSAFYIGPLLLLTPFLVYLVISIRAAICCMVLNFILILYPNREWPKIRFLFQLWYELFDLHHNVTTATEKIFTKENHLSILAMHPHGIIPIQGFIWAAFCDQYLPVLYGIGATTDIAQRLPILRQLLTWLSAGSADREVLKTQMQVNNKNVYILPGGVAEIFFSRRLLTAKNKDSQVHVIKGKRYGLMKMALQTGALIVPSYVFGGTEFFDQFATIGNDNNHEGFVGRFFQSLSRHMKGGITFYWGQYKTPMPHFSKVTMVLGDPIVPFPGTLGDESNGVGSGRKRTCKKIPNPTNKQVEELMQRYVDAMQMLFDQYKAQAGYANDVLKVI